MQVLKTNLSGVLIIEPRVFHDERGCFSESFQSKRYQQSDLPAHFVQDNYSRSKRNVVRGLHYQQQHPQGKLVFVISGHILDVAVDIRLGSPTFGKSIAVELSEDNFRQLYVPAGFAHGFCVLSERADVIYKCTEYYFPHDEHGILWNDPDLHIPWPIERPIISSKDLEYSCLKEIGPTQLPIIL